MLQDGNNLKEIKDITASESSQWIILQKRPVYRESNVIYIGFSFTRLHDLPISYLFMVEYEGSNIQTPAWYNTGELNHYA